MSEPNPRDEEPKTWKTFQIQPYQDGLQAERPDDVAIEEPLEVRVVAQTGELAFAHSISVTMRTPGHDFELALGFLFTENVIAPRDWVERVAFQRDEKGRENCNVVEVHLKADVPFDPAKLTRHVFTSSSCGICGKMTIDQVRQAVLHPPVRCAMPRPETFLELPKLLAEAQTGFQTTGGLHASALFDLQGQLIVVREDVGRHNALDKVIGFLFERKRLPASDTMLLVSGRASFELVQKAIMAGIPVLAAVGAPSSLAVDLANEFGMILIGFLGKGRFNCYRN